MPRRSRSGHGRHDLLHQVVGARLLLRHLHLERLGGDPTGERSDRERHADQLGLPFAATQDSTDATVSTTDPPSSCGFVSTYTLWYSYTAPTDGVIKVRTTGHL